MGAFSIHRKLSHSTPLKPTACPLWGTPWAGLRGESKHAPTPFSLFFRPARYIGPAGALSNMNQSCFILSDPSIKPRPRITHRVPHRPDQPDAPAPTRRRSFAELWLEAQHALGGFVHLHVPDHALADDIMQEVARQATEHFEQYDHDRPFIAWLIGIARQRIAQAYRAQGRRPIVFSSEMLDAITHAYTDMQPTEDDRLDGLRICMSRLSDRHRRVIELRYARQMTSQQIADQVACSPRAVTSMLQRIRSALRKCVAQYMEAQR